jgi:hypothetical protein
MKAAFDRIRIEFGASLGTDRLGRAEETPGPSRHLTHPAEEV